MAENPAQTDPAANPAPLFGAVTLLALHLASDLELAPREGEDETALSIRLLGEIAPRAEALVDRAADLDGEVKVLKRRLAGHKGRAGRLQGTVAALEAQLSKKPRKFAVVEPPEEAEAARAHRAGLLELIDDAETVELAFTDDRGTELAVAPRLIEGGAAAWQLAENGLRLRVPSLELKGPAPGDAAYPLGGYALVLDGEAVATQRRAQLTIGAGQTYRLEEDVIF